MRELARVARDRVLVVDTLTWATTPSEAETLRDPSHVRNYARGRVARLPRGAGLRVEEQRVTQNTFDFAAWLAARGCEGEEAERVARALGRPRRATAARRSTRSLLKAVRCLMAILVDKDTQLVVQGLTGSEGRFHGLRNRGYGTDVVAGVTPGKGGQDVEGIPVFDTVADAVSRAGREHGDDLRPGAASPPTRSTRQSTPASRTVICITEDIPAHEMLRIYTYVRARGRDADRPELPGRALARARRTSGSSRRRSSARAPSASSPARAR